MIICISGTPATGKTTIAKKLMQELDFPVLDVKRFIEEKDLSEGYDKKKKCKIVDEQRLSEEILKEIKKVQDEKKPKGIIIDSHLSHYLPSKIIDLCIITKCDLKVLESRLKKRKYSKKKIRENLDSEIFDICFHEAVENKHRPIVIDTTKPIKMDSVLQKIGERHESASKSTKRYNKR